MNSITLKPEMTELHVLNEFILNELSKEDMQVNLIAEEIFVNIVNYSKTDFITVNADYADSILTLEFVDNGIKFNPLLKEDPEFPNDIDDVNIGGFGILLAKELADELEYHYIDGENHLKIIKTVVL
jgi:anti-sigma regulatory factor (Ser/Thr protein kinase)